MCFAFIFKQTGEESQAFLYGPSAQAHHPRFPPFALGTVSMCIIRPEEYQTVMNLTLKCCPDKGQIFIAVLQKRDNLLLSSIVFRYKPCQDNINKLMQLVFLTR